MHLVVGLGNPGQDYARTRHNVGFMFLDYLADRHNATFVGSKWQAQTATLRLSGEMLTLVKPETYMNRSGLSVSRIAAYYKVATERIIVVHDDLDLPVGRMKLMNDRGAGGHNGIRSLIEHLASKEFPRFKIGIGRPQDKTPVEKYVLANFIAEEFTQTSEMFPAVEKGLCLLLEKGVLAAMNQVNTRA
ncbi:MAG: aminoacyl-tRNA hydrolase [Desulfobulbaceae bacterium]|nr:aminoacyl-tRNA hydrolase [Desulfobulbaceae bacterium]